MIEIELNRIEADYGFEIKDANGHTVLSDTSDEHGGKNYGVRPMQLLLMGLASCSAIDVISILKKQRYEVKGYRTVVRGEREEGVEPSLWKNIEMEIQITGDIETGRAQRAAELSIHKYCSVAATLSKAGADIKWSVTVLPEVPAY